MQKLFSMFVVGGVVSATALPAFACGGGGGGGCSMSGGGGGYAYTGRALASGKVSGRSPMLAQAAPQAGRPQAGRPQAGSPTKALAGTNKPAASLAVRTVANAKSAAPAPVYTCPMHPQVQWTKPTDCPICGMKLKLKPAKADATKRAPAADDHAGINMDEMGEVPNMGQDGMSGMEDMQMCPGCMMGGMSGMKGKQAPTASQKASGGSMRMAGMGCGC